MSKQLQIGLIGAGMIGDMHIDCIRRDGRADVTWIASRTAHNLRRKLKKFAIPDGTTDYRELLADPQLDAVVIASPPYTHLQMVKDALVAGKHILLEKPMVINRRELQELRNIVTRFPDRIILECSCRHTRLQPKYDFIKKMIRTDQLGEIYHIHHQGLKRGTFIEYNPAGAWAHQMSLAGGGPVMDLGVYDLAFHLGLLDDKPQIDSVHSFTRKGLKNYQDPAFESDIEEHAAAWLTFDTGLTYYYERGSGVQCEAPNQTRIHATKGSLRFGYCSWDPPEAEYFHHHNGKQKQTVLNVPIPAGHDDHLALIRHFLDVLIEGATPQMTVDVAAKHLDILFRILGNE